MQLAGCAMSSLPPGFEVVDTGDFPIAALVRDTDAAADFAIYIEGDGHAFNARGDPTRDPTPRGDFVRRLARGDTGANVAYIARPCQFVSNEKCSEKYWTSARFAPEVIDTTARTIEKISGGRGVTLIGFSGGAQVAGLVAVLHPEIKVKKIMTYAGNLEHAAWTAHHKLAPLNESLNLADYRDEYLKIPATHYVGEHDKVIPPKLVTDFVGDGANVIVVSDAGHGW
jgi:hypothetical protein